MVLFVGILSSCGTVRRTRAVRKPAATQEEDLLTVTGIVVQNDTKGKTMQIRELDSDGISNLTYGAASAFQNAYQEAIDGSEVGLGWILQADYRRKDARIVSASVPENAWEYQDIRKFDFSADEGTLNLGDRRYQYSGLTYFASDGVAITPMELSSQDVLTVRGIGIQAYSVVRTGGHGYIRLANYQDFMGGIVEVGDSLMLPVSKNMLITMAEGTYRLTLLKRATAATKTVTVQKDKEVTVDFSTYTPKKTNIGEVKFNIEPEGASLYINGNPIKYSKPVVLHYGKYKVAVTMAGYEPYSGILEVAQSFSTIHIDLPEKHEEATPSPSPTPTSTVTVEEEDDSQITKKIDSSHKITVSAPKGAEVYLDNVYKGFTPCSFTKVIGSQTITLSSPGYVTKSYKVDILDDNSDVTLSFADLVKDEPTPEPEPTATGIQ